MTGSVSGLNNRSGQNKSDLFGYVAGLEAAGAHFDVHGCSAKFCFYGNDIRLPHAAGVVVGLADLVAAHGALTANFASTRHINLPFRKGRTHPLQIQIMEA